MTATSCEPTYWPRAGTWSAHIVEVECVRTPKTAENSAATDDRWKIERTICLDQGFRRLVVRHEYYSFIYQGFIHLACILICLRRF